MILVCLELLMQSYPDGPPGRGLGCIESSDSREFEPYDWKTLCQPRSKWVQFLNQ